MKKYPNIKVECKQISDMSTDLSAAANSGLSLMYSQEQIPTQHLRMSTGLTSRITLKMILIWLT